ncbi:hypothetical protein TVAGG3_0139420 [Trichomonas vaginalis G3]|uniref:hypothetical protein n=1 Tax=Trichomonas vaginalis (strain ATCC PRA-98 / G3) TaxID=412133 RepID=UPI0021E556DF|nr:hypothetical protein TVAGG3_0139420 [Trichomonas vaginalis G3]KAI5546529.1 hypothetical protein TVAGG3_0139420 [Trichomonas vaginalis G3]
MWLLHNIRQLLNVRTFCIIEFIAFHVESIIGALDADKHTFWTSISSSYIHRWSSINACASNRLFNSLAIMIVHDYIPSSNSRQGSCGLSPELVCLQCVCLAVNIRR